MEYLFSLLKTKYPDLTVLHYDSIDSTNSEAKRRKEIKRGIILSEHQTAGRGRQGNSFYSPKSTGLYMSVVLPVSPTEAYEFLLTAAAAVAAAVSIEEVCNVYCGIKWVNDLYLHGRKVAGILTEADTDRVIVGIGINMATADFPSELTQAGSINAPVSLKTQLAEKIAERLFELAERKDRSFMEEYRLRDILRGKEIFYEKNYKPYCARVLGIDDLGCLWVETDDGFDTLSSGEVHILMK